jgi:prefoldin subunit 5
MEALKSQSDFFQKQMDALNQRIRELEELAAKKGGSSA